MSKLASLFLLVVSLLVSRTATASETSPRPLRQTELLALVAGNALPENIVNEIRTRGVAFRLDDSFRAQLTTVGATPSILAALGAAKAPAKVAAEDKPDPVLLQHIAAAAKLMQEKHYDEAADELTSTLKGNFEKFEIGVGSGAHRKVVVIGSDVMSSILDYHDRATCVLFGDGAGAVLVEPAKDGEGILDFSHDVDGSGGQYLYMPGGGSLHPSTHETIDKNMHVVHQEGSQVFKYAVRRMAELAACLLERNGFTSDDLALVVPHQANLRIIRAMQQRLGVEDSKVMVNIDKYGNTTGGTIPLGLRDAVDQGRLKKGDLVLLAAVGAGYTTGGLLMRWAY
jgi:3-oxoacyl-[acyl-carrier-protein] synthase-3